MQFSSLLTIITKYISGKVGGQWKIKLQDLPESGGLQTENVPWRLSYNTVKVIINTGMFEMVLMQPRKKDRQPKLVSSR